MRKRLWTASVILFIAYAIFGLNDPYYRAKAIFCPPTLPADAVHANIPQEMVQLDKMDHAASEFARSGHSDIYEVNTLDFPENSVHYPGTAIIVLNRARLSTVELRALALSHELYHAAHHFSLSDLFITEEYKAHLHISKLASAYGIPLPANNMADLATQFAPTIFLLLSALAAVAGCLSPK